MQKEEADLTHETKIASGLPLGFSFQKSGSLFCSFLEFYLKKISDTQTKNENEFFFKNYLSTKGDFFFRQSLRKKLRPHRNRLFISKLTFLTSSSGSFLKSSVVFLRQRLWTRAEDAISRQEEG